MWSKGLPNDFVFRSIEPPIPRFISLPLHSKVVPPPVSCYRFPSIRIISAFGAFRGEVRGPASLFPGRIPEMGRLVARDSLAGRFSSGRGRPGPLGKPREDRPYEGRGMKPPTSLTVKLLHCGNVNPANPRDRREKNMFFMPMGLFPIASHLKEHGFGVEIVHLDLESHLSLEEILEPASVDAVGMDCHWINQALTVTETAKMIKGLAPHLFLFLGGYSASFFAREILEGHPCIDAVIRGDGELPAVELCQALADIKARRPGASLERVSNLVWRRENGEVTENERRYVATSRHMDELRYADLPLLRNWDLYRDLCRFWTRFPEINSQPLFFLEIGRGCSYNCSFCGGNSKAQKRIGHRTGQILRSPESVLETVRQGASLGFSLFYTCFESESSEEWALELLGRIREEGLRISFGYGAWRLPSQRLTDALATTCEHVLAELSPESASEDLRRLNKDHRLFYSNAELEGCLEYAGSKRNVKVQAYFGYPLPGDTESSVRQTMAYARELAGRFGRFAEFPYTNLSTDPGSLMHLDPEKLDVHMEVKTFEDYLIKLRETYVEKHDSSPDMTAFRPRSLSEEAARRLMLEIRGHDGAPAETESQERVLGVWRELPGLERAGVDDDFFELGGDEELAARLAARLKEAFGVEIPPEAVFQAPTVRELTELTEALLVLEMRGLSPEDPMQ